MLEEMLRDRAGSRGKENKCAHLAFLTQRSCFTFHPRSALRLCARVPVNDLDPLGAQLAKANNSCGARAEFGACILSPLVTNHRGFLSAKRQEL